MEYLAFVSAKDIIFFLKKYIYYPLLLGSMPVFAAQCNIFTAKKTPLGWDCHFEPLVNRRPCQQTKNVWLVSIHPQ